MNFALIRFFKWLKDIFEVFGYFLHVLKENKWKFEFLEYKILTGPAALNPLLWNPVTLRRSTRVPGFILVFLFIYFWCCLLLWLRVRFTCSHTFLCLVNETNLILFGRPHWFLLPSRRIGEAAKCCFSWLFLGTVEPCSTVTIFSFFFVCEKPMRKV